MTPKLSDLELLDFSIIKSGFQFREFQEGEKIMDIVKNYEIDIDFAFPIDGKGLRVFVKVAINDKNKLPGYSIFAEGVSFFKLKEGNKLSDIEKEQLTQYSAFSITLNSIRGFITSLTANAPLGKYILPSIDVTDLFKQKASKHVEVRAKKTVKKN